MGRYTTEIISDDDFIRIVKCIKNGYSNSRPNERIAVILQVAYNTGASINEIIKLRQCDFLYKKGIWLFSPDARYDIKTYVIATKVKKIIDEYCEKYIKGDRTKTFAARIFGQIGAPAVWKVLRSVTEYLGLEKISSKSFKKRSIVRIFESSSHNDEIVYEFLQMNHSQGVDDILTSIDGKKRYMGFHRS